MYKPGKIEIMFFLKGIILICFLTPLLFSQGTGVKFERFGTEDGMSANSTLCMLQDKKGFMWYGSQNGLNRYDGYGFKQFFHDPSYQKSISNNYIYKLCEDKTGGIWISLPYGANRYDPKTGTFRRFLIDSAITKTTNINSVLSVYCSKDSMLWFCTNAGRLFSLPPDFFMYPNADSLWNNALLKSYKLTEKEINVVYESGNEEFWAGTGNGLIKFIPGTNNNWYKEKYLLNSGKEPNSLSNNIKLIYETETEPGIIIAGSYGGLYAFNPRTKRSEPWPSSKKIAPEYRDGNFYGILEVEPGLFYIIYEGLGLLIYDKYNDSIKEIKHNPNDPQSLSTDKLFSIYMDRSENIWLGALSGELNKLRLNKSYFSKYIHIPGKKDALSDSYVTSVYQDSSGLLWVGTRGGGINVGKLTSPNSRSKKRYSFGMQNKVSKALKKKYVKAIKEDSYGNIWIGLWGDKDGLIRYNRKNDKLELFKNDPVNPRSISSTNVRCFWEDSKKRLWVGTTTGGLSQVVNYSNPDDKKIYFVNYAPGDSKNSISQDDIFSLSETYVNGKFLLWIGTYTNGLNCFDPETKTFTLFKNEPGNKNSICDNNIKTLFTDSRQNLWIGTANGIALLRRNRHDDFRFELITTEDGLPDAEVNAIREDDNGNLWIGTGYGLTKYNPRNKNFVNFNESDGLPGNEFVLNAEFKNKYGEIFIGGIKGLAHFHPDSVVNESVVPAVVITSFKVFEKELKLDSALAEISTINLSYDQNFFSIEFAALDFQNVSENKFAYKMEGIHDEWLFSDNRNYVSFSHLPPGEYIFRVKGSNDDGVWNERGAVLAINILPPFWMTIWFRIAIAIIVLTCSVLLIRYIATRKLKKKIREMEIQNKIQQERQQISDDLHDHIGSHLSNIITGLEISGHLIPQKEKTRLNDHILNLEKYTRNTIKELRQTMGSLNQKESSIKLLAEHIYNLVEDQARLNNKPEIKFNYKPDDKPLSPLCSLNIFRICQEALNNAIKYSKAAEILINLNSGKRLLLLKISDNGVGFKYPDVNIKGNGQGLASMQRRAERMGGKLTIHSSVDEGTTIELAISIKEK